MGVLVVFVNFIKRGDHHQVVWHELLVILNLEIQQVQLCIIVNFDELGFLVNHIGLLPSPEDLGLAFEQEERGEDFEVVELVKEIQRDTDEVLFVLLEEGLVFNGGELEDVLEDIELDENRVELVDFIHNI